jgi:hypothetical protein
VTPEQRPGGHFGKPRGRASPGRAPGTWEVQNFRSIRAGDGAWSTRANGQCWTRRSVTAGGSFAGGHSSQLPGALLPGADHRHCGADERGNREGQGAGGQPTGGRGNSGGGGGRHRIDRRPGTAVRASAAPRRLRRDAGRNRGVCIADAGGSCRSPRRLRRNGQRCTRAADHAGELQPDPAAGRRRPARNGLGYAGLVAHPDGLHLETARGADDPHLVRAADIRAREARHPPDQIHAYPESAVPAHGAAAV